MHRLLLSLCATQVAALAAPPDDPGARPNGPFPHAHRCHALIGGDVVTAPGTRLDDAVIVIRDGVIVAVGHDVDIPVDARLWPMDDRVIYPAFIEPAASIETEFAAGPSSHWNDRIHPELDLRSSGASLPKKDREKFRGAGYGVVAVYPDEGILRGTGTITSTAAEDGDLITYDGTPAMAASFERGGWGSGNGPGSLMGSIALCRQTLSDARWYAAASDAAARNNLEPPSKHDDLAALQAVTSGRQPLMVDVRSVKEATRAAALADEMDVTLTLLGSGDEYLDLSGVAKAGCPVIVPVNFPERPKLSSIDAAIRVSLRTLQEWEQAPTNLRRLAAASVPTCVTTRGLDAPRDVTGGLRQAIKAGLSTDAALAQLTTAPASMLGIDDRVGTIAPGMAAHLVVCGGDLFDEETSIEETWISGHREDHDPDPFIALTGTGSMRLGDAELEATVDTAASKLSVTLDDDSKAKVKKVTMTGHRLTASIDGRLLGMESWVRLAGVIRGDAIIGRGVLPDGTSLPLRITLTDEADASKPVSSPDDEATDDTTPRDAVAGTWSGSIAFGTDFEPPIELVVVREEGGELSGTVNVMEQEMPLEDGSFDESSGTLEFVGDATDVGGYRILAQIDGDHATGTATSPMGEAQFTVSRESGGGDDKNDDTPEARWSGIPEHITYPLGARGRIEPPAPADARFEHATLWTADDAGIIQDGCLVVRGGKLAYVGTMDDAPNGDEVVVDASGMHITPGLIDCHSHTGIDGGVNEFNEACTAEVGIGDVVSGDDVNWYRQLAGGLTAANQLHGSANPIGGRNCVVKLRWSRPARAFPIEGAPPGIKFALGENVKRSSGRYPDTRMGVEAFMRDRLSAATHYAARWDRWNDLSDAERAAEMPPRRDYELDALAEILAGERLIHCHSYRQDEILALLRTCEAFGITIGTLQHILEGYKVADDIANHGAGASSFSDWWAYKVEVMDAIPWNGAIMHDQGVLVSFNSDDSELATRMNDEAAKAVRYGGLEPNEALKFVTLNPARQLKVDHLTGSLKAGKDADFAVWNMDPLDSYSLCTQTWIDGAKYFDRADDAALAARDAAERTRLVELVLHESLGEPPALAGETTPDAAEETQPAWAANPYLEPADDHRGCCGVPTDHTHSEDCR